LNVYLYLNAFLYMPVEPCESEEQNFKPEIKEKDEIMKQVYGQIELEEYKTNEPDGPTLGETPDKKKDIDHVKNKAWEEI